MDMIIKTTGLTKRYGEQTVVNGVAIHAAAGEIYGFLGRNGAGKTTTIRMLLGLIRPDAGQIEIFGLDFARHQREILRRTGSLVEFSGFYENLTARENLGINTRLIGVHQPRAIDEALEIVGLEHETHKLAGQYSLGMKQRLAIARSILHRPELLILDEPTNGLDPMGIKEMRHLIKSLAVERKITILMSSHILSEVEQLADRVGILHEGSLLEEIRYEDLCRKNRNYLEVQVSNDSKSVMLLEREFHLSDYEVHENGTLRLYSHLDQAGAINRCLVQNGIEVQRLSPSADRLEDYFVRLIGGVSHD